MKNLQGVWSVRQLPAFTVLLDVRDKPAGVAGRIVDAQLIVAVANGESDEELQRRAEDCDRVWPWVLSDSTCGDFVDVVDGRGKFVAELFDRDDASAILSSVNRLRESWPSVKDELREFRVVVPRPGRATDVSYPPAGHALYTRAEAWELLRIFRDSGLVGDREPWAESRSERFCLSVNQEATANGTA
jgi:hypothetical protein